MDRSPAVDRVTEDVERMVRDRGETTPLLIDWLTVLLADDDGRPAGLLQKLQTGPIDALIYATELITHHRPAPNTDVLWTRGRELASVLRADPTLTTDALFLAVIETCETVDGGLSGIGLSLQKLADAFGDRPEAASVSPLFTDVAPVDHKPTLLRSHDFAIHDPFDTAQLHRILDACLNRAREAIRVVEDYARFGRNDQVLTNELKSIRHELAEACERLPVSLRHRDTPGDVGTALGTSREYVRTSPRETALVNMKRLQEALRSIEEYGKQIDTVFAKRVEQLRYRAYTAEQSCLGTTTLAQRLTDATLYVLLTAKQCTAAIDWTVREAAAGGATIFQLREKDISDREWLERAKLVRRVTRETNTLFIMNDRPDLARLAQADGLHLGQDDLNLRDARMIVGPEMLIGISTHDTEQVRQAVRDGADYLGVGPVFPSTTKAFDHFPGLDFIREAGQLTSLPLFALGGISAANVGQVKAAGISRVAVASAVTTSDDPQAAARALS